MNVVYDCNIPPVMGYAERAYCFLRGNDALLMWEGYFSDLMEGMWKVYGSEFDANNPDHLHPGQVPLLREWCEQGWIGSDGPLPIAELPATTKAFRNAAAELRQTGANLPESPQHGEALAAFLEEAVSSGQPVTVEEWWG